MLGAKVKGAWAQKPAASCDGQALRRFIVNGYLGKPPDTVTPSVDETPLAPAQNAIRLRRRPGNIYRVCVVVPVIPYRPAKEAVSMLSTTNPELAHALLSSGPNQ